MLRKKVKKQIGPPGRMPTVLTEIVDKLLSDDWERLSTEDGTHFYYIVGTEDYYADFRRQFDFKTWQIPSGKATRAPKRSAPLADSYVRSQLAQERRDYLKDARKRLEDGGVSPEVINRFVAGEINLSLLPNNDLPLEERMEAVTQFYQAYLLSISKQQDIKYSLDDIQEITLAREKSYLREVSRKYKRMVRLGSKLERLSFEDAQLEEASRCYLYGFHRATIVLSATALETRLKRCTGKNTDKVGDLVRHAKSQGKVDEALASFANKIFGIRNRVVHANAPADAQEAEEALYLARQVVDHLQSL